MAKKQRATPNSQIRSALRLLFLRSRERAEALRRDGYCCQICKKKQSKVKGKEVKVEVHHINADEERNWQLLIESIRSFLLCDADNLIVLCSNCHEKLHKGEN